MKEKKTDAGAQAKTALPSRPLQRKHHRAIARAGITKPDMPRKRWDNRREMVMQLCGLNYAFPSRK
jgi:hypothetical protein